MNDLSNKYFVRKDSNSEWEDVTTKFLGVRILSITGFNSLGEAINVYSEQWVNSPKTDFLVTSQDERGNDVIIRKNGEVSLTFICGERYGAEDTQEANDAFVDYITKHGDLYIKSAYTNKVAHVICLQSYEPTTEKLHRGNRSYIMGTIKLDLLEPVGIEGTTVLGELYIGFGSTSLANMSAIQNLANVQHYNAEDAHGTYTITCPSLSYLWICSSGTIGRVLSDNFEIPMEDAVVVAGLNCYRSSNNIQPHTMTFTITL